MQEWVMGNRSKVIWNNDTEEDYYNKENNNEDN